MRLSIRMTCDSGSFLYKYLNRDKRIMKYYDYDLSDSGKKARYDELMGKDFRRQELADALFTYNKACKASGATFRQIEKLKNSSSVVVAGGQQAGLLTGPLYTLNKIMTILIEAENLERELDAPVIPVFWIAGEDHDIDEVNHTFFYDRSELRKVRLSERNDLKQPVSERKINISEAQEELKHAFQFLRETSSTGKLYEMLEDDLYEGITYSDWFATIIHRLFEGTGLVLMDAADPHIRKIEQSFFKEMVDKNDLVQQAFYSQASAFKEDGYGEPITHDDKNAHLFFHENGQRHLLNRQEGIFEEKGGGRTWSEASLAKEVGEGRLQLSNNVVTRPVMQDLLLPVHSFIAGPGELAYWGVLKKTFHCFDRKMPLVRPRYHTTFLSRRSEKNLARYDLTPDYVTLNGTEEQKKEWVEHFSPVDEEGVFEAAKHEAADWAENLKQQLSPLGSGAEKIAGRFETRLMTELNDFNKRIDQFIYDNNRIHINRLEQIEAEIRPDAKWQERYLNVYPFLNNYGSDLVLRTLNAIKYHNGKLPVGSHIYIHL